MNTATTSTHRLPVASRPSRLGAFGAYDWLFAALVIAGTGFAFWRYGASMDVYEKWILAGSAPVVIGLG
jgi:hypothetical protein